MKALAQKSYAKINLTLDVLGRDVSGYHRVQTIIHEVPSLYDELRFETLDSPQILFECDDPTIPIDESNTIIRATKSLQKIDSKKKGAKIKLKKNIPQKSGLGGAASNAAATLKALNELWGFGLSVRKLRTLAAEIGMDVPFFITGGAALGMHYGEQLMHLPPLQTHPDLKSYTIEIIQTDIPISTEEAYSALYLSECGRRNRDTGTLVKILKGEETGEIEPLLHNDFEAQFFRKYPELKERYPSAHLSGSGGALYRLI